MTSQLDYQIQLESISRGYDRQTCWTQARGGTLPPASANENPTVVVTMQKLLLTGSDVYHALHTTRSSDLGHTWTLPVEQENFRRAPADDATGVCESKVVCDFYPKWHAGSGLLLGTGHTAYYDANNKIPANRPRETAYAVYDPATHYWRDWKTLAMPEGGKFRCAGAGCTQRVDLPNGEILLPIYFQIGTPYLLAVTVVRCGFDGETLEYIEHGTELTVPAPRGLGEPSLTYFQGRYLLTLRNDERGYITAGEDGLHFGEPQLWRFDNGEELGNYNTQQHWVTHSGGLFLTYTRRGLNNDHVFRHRAPIVMAQVDPDRLCVLRDTERVVIPERGARLGNFGITEVSPHETWITETEWMQNSGPWAQTMLQKLRETHPEDKVQEWAQTPHLCAACEQFGSDNTVWAARILWQRPASGLPVF